MKRKFLVMLAAGIMCTGTFSAIAQNTNTNTSSSGNTGNTNTGTSGNTGNTNTNSSRRNTNSNRTTSGNTNRSTTSTTNSNSSTSNMDTNNSSRNNNGSMNGNGARAMAALQAPDQKFLMDAIMGNNAEIAMGQLALQRASSPDVKSFAQMMIDQHTTANNELMTMAQGNTMTMTPGMIDPMHRALADAMSRLSGADFDMAYIKSQMADHALARDIYERYSKNGDNKDLKNYAKKTRPTIEQHYSTVQNLDTRMAPTAMMTPAPTGP